MDKRHYITIRVNQLLMATRYVAQCATSPVSLNTIRSSRDHLPYNHDNSFSTEIDESETQAEDDSSEIVYVEPKFFSTRGNTEAMKSIYPSYVVLNERTKVHLETDILGDNYYKMIAFTHQDTECVRNSLISPTCKSSMIKSSRSFHSDINK